MNKGILLILLMAIGLSFNLGAQSNTSPVENIRVSSSNVKLLGTSKPIRDLVQKPTTSPIKKEASRRLKKVPDNFKGRKEGGNTSNQALAYQGPDPIRQTHIGGRSVMATTVEPFVNIDGLNIGSSPHDPTGDVSDEFYVQAINVTEVGVYDLDGNLVQQFAMNTLWAEFNASSEGDPIILYDENVEKWVVTEFTDPANILVAISDTKDPLGSYTAYSFSTPQFPDYPKYAITPKALVVTTNEGGAGVLHQYFIELDSLYAGAANVTMIRVEIDGNTGTEAGFFVSTPVDWNGTNQPYDERPVVVRINDSSWPGGPAQDQIEVFAFNVDFADPNNTTVDQTSIITTPFDSYPCASETPGTFACIPQMGGMGLDGVPEVVMNIPHLRNFGTHESMVFNFVTDITDGNNIAGIRWVELRRTANTDWTLYQEGTFGLDDGLHRFMGSIAIDGKGNIGMVYNVSSENDFAGVRFTGRFASDPLGMMTFDEVNLVDGESTVNAFGRFGDYSQIAVAPKGDNAFWCTAEYARANDVGTRIAAFRVQKDTFDLAANAILSPVTSDALGASEMVTATFANTGLTALADFNVGFMLDGSLVESMPVSSTLMPDSSISIQFSTPIDLSTIRAYDLTVFINHPQDQRPGNDTLKVEVSKLASINGGLTSTPITQGCSDTITTSITLTNFGGQNISTASIDVVVNGTVVDNITFNGSLTYLQENTFSYTLNGGLQVGNNTIEFVINTINGSTDEISSNDSSSFTFNLLEADQFVILRIIPDDFPEESSWVLTEATTGIEIISGSLPEDLTEPFEQEICLDLSGCYQLVFMDSYGDGICCDVGNGSFEILNNQGIAIVSNDGNFGSEVTEEFCPSEICTLTATFDIENATGATAADGSILINAANGVGPFQYSIDGGNSFQSSSLFENLLPGDYDIVVIAADTTCNYRETITVNFTTGLYEINGQQVEVKILPNPTSGVFQVLISNLQINEPLLQLEIFDVNGRFVQRRIIGQYNQDYMGTLSLYDYPNGHYFLRIMNKEVNILERIVKTE